MNPTQQVPKNLQQKLQAALEQAAQDANTPDIGLTVGVVTPAGAWTGATGVSNLETLQATQPDDLFNIASISKAYTSAVILKLQEQGKLSLDDTLGQWLPEIAAEITNGKNLTIRQLLNGTGGVWDYINNEEFVSDVFADYLSGSNRDWRSEDLVKYAYGKPLFSGGFSTDKWTYTNTGNVFAALIAEKADGRPFKQILREEILESLELKNTFFSSQDVAFEKRAKGYEDVFTVEGTPGRDGILEDFSSINTETSFGNGSIVSSAEDVALFFNALASGELLSPDSTAEIFNYVDTGITEFTIALDKFGLGVYPTQSPWGKARSMSGSIVGYGSLVSYFPNGDTTISALINQGTKSTLMLQAFTASLANTLDLNTAATMHGTGGDDYLKGTFNNALINGLKGDDILIGNKGLDALDGGEGNDLLDGREEDDYLFGKNGDDSLYGSQGNDFLNGGAGDDFLGGGADNDALIGGNGDDRISGGEGDDTLSGGADNDILRDTQGNNILYGNDGDDWLRAGRGDDFLYGDAGSDRIWAKAGHDQLFGGIGDDSLNGGQGDDRLIGGEGRDMLSGASGNDALAGDGGCDLLFGGANNDSLRGGAGNDVLRGGSGEDILNGDSGNDWLRGGAGGDRFLLSSGRDVILDFQDGHDLLALPALNTNSLSFNDLDIVQIGRHTEIRWQAPEGNGSWASQMNVTVLRGIQASQITAKDYDS